MQTLPGVKEVDGYKGIQILSPQVPRFPARMHCLTGTMFYKVLNLNAFEGQSTVQSATDSTTVHDLTHLAFHPFLLCAWLLKTFGFANAGVH